MTQRPTSIHSFDYAFHLTSLLDLSAVLHKGKSASELLGMVLLSIMGRLGVTKSCALLPTPQGFRADLVRGFPEFNCPGLEGPVLNTVIIETDSELSLSLPEKLIELGVGTTIPLVYDGKIIAILCLGKMKLPNRSSEGLVNYLSLVKMMTTIAVHNAGVVSSLMSTSEELRAQNLMVTTMFEISRDFTAAKSKRELLKIIALHLMGRLVITSFALCFNEPIDGEQVIYTKIVDEDLESLIPDVLEIDGPVRVSELDISEPLTKKLLAHRIELAVPMNVNGEKRGVLVTRGKLSKAEFTNDDLAFLQAVGNTAMTAIDNERLSTAETILKSEMAIALEIQRNLLPEETPIVEGVDLATYWHASRTIGGDYYDVIPVSAGKTLFAIADVAGKGVPAALLMANTQSALTILAQLDLPLTVVAHKLNSLLCENTKPEVFVTMFLAIVDTINGQLSYVCMGHNPPILVTSAGVEYLSEGGVLAGVVTDPPPYEMGVRKLNVGDTLMMYTDGVTECTNVNGIEFGVDGITRVLNEQKNSTAKVMCDSFVAELKSHGKGTSVADDTTIMVIRIL
ncbi:MAG: SpoIIE family protein phosphatase [Ignavibacteria bacterium]|nr:SpoIIE family protein phosphatase [Ignavibacteria bacterium]